MNDFDTPGVLAVGARLANLARAKVADAVDLKAQVAEVDAGRRGFELLRVLRFDVVAVGLQLPDMTPWEFSKRMKVLWPWQKWALVADVVEPEEEVMARTLGAVAVLEGPDAWKQIVEVASVIHRKNPATRVPGMSLRTGSTGTV